MDNPRLELDIHQVFERVTDACVALDRDWRYTYLNATACELFGRKAEELIGRHIWTEFAEGVVPPFRLACEKAMTEQCPQQVETFYPPYHRWFENRV
jgi:PAS domain S-box-containing protein